jgi:hypothetical protein
MEKDLTYKIKDYITIIGALISLGVVLYSVFGVGYRVQSLESNFSEFKTDNKEFREETTKSINEINKNITKIMTTLKIN